MTRPLLSVAEAQQRLLGGVTPLAEALADLRHAAGRWAAADITAKRTQPEQPLSAMDGYAIRYTDLPGPFQLIGESAAGRPFAGRLSPGETVRIFTGATMPDGADTVMVQEEAARQGMIVHLTGEGPGHLGRNVRPRGLDFSAGQTLIAAGTHLTAGRIALAAAAGHAALPVRRRVRVAMLATGDELVPAGAPIAAGQLPESNGTMLAAMLADMPVDLTDLGIIGDDLDRLTAAVAGVDADILVTTGGASVGDHDLVRPALEAAGGNIDFWRIALRPGKPMMAGTLGRAAVLGLPGNPVSAFVTATLFLKPLIARLGGSATPLPKPLMAVLGEGLPANDHRQDYLRGRLRDGRVQVAAVQDSSMLLTLACADCLVIRPPHAPAALPGDPVEILPIA